jgi:hypothetical protein
MLLDCPAYLDQDGALRCGLPAEVRCRLIMRSTDGPIECAMIRCPAGHCFNGAIDSLTWDGKRNHHPGTAAVTSRSARDSVPGGHDGRDGASGSALRDSPPSQSGKFAARTVRPPTTWAAVPTGGSRHAPAPHAHRLPFPDRSRRHWR